MKKLTLYFVVLMVTSVALGDFSKSFLYKINPDDEKPSYIFGFVPSPNTRVWDASPANARAAFKAADRVFLEPDFNDPFALLKRVDCHWKGNAVINTYRVSQS